MTPDELYVRNAGRKGILYFTQHAYDKMKIHKISTLEVVKCIENGEIIEKQSGRVDEDPRLVFYNGHDYSFYVVVAVGIHICVTVTVCMTDYSVWEKEGDGIKRRED